MITCTCAVRGPETCPHPRHRAARWAIALDPVAVQALADLPQPVGIPADVLTPVVETNARLLASDD